MTGAACATLYAIFADSEEATRIARAMVAERLAACVNILTPCRSVYRWEGRIEEATETPALFKTRPALAPRLMARIAELHSYEVPAMTLWEAAAVPASFAAWLAANTR